MKIRSIPWARISAEFLVIFVGVTMGLAADDWLQAQQDRGDAVILLADLSADLQADSAGLAEMALTMQRYDHGAVWLRSNLRAASAEPDSIVTHLRRLMFTSFYQPVASAYVALKEGGQMPLIREHEVRRRIVDYYEVTQPRMLQFDQQLRAAQIEFRTRAVNHFGLVPESATGSSWPPGQLELVTTWDAVGADHGLRTAIEELGIQAAAWVLNIEQALEQNAELRQRLGYLP